MNFYDRLRPYLSRFLIAPLAVGAANWAAGKLGIQVDSGTLATTVDLAIYGAVHKAADKVINPADTASHHLAVEGVDAKTRIVGP